MGGPSRNRVYLVQRFKRDEAARLTLEQAKVAVENWNAALAAGEPPHPSPSLALIRRAGYRWLQVWCDGCETTTWIDCDKINADPRREIAQLARRMRCRGQAPPPRIEALLKERPHNWADTVWT